MDAIKFIDLHAQRSFLGSRIEEAMDRVLEHGKFILGPEVVKFERELAEFGNMSHAISCGNGTDALQLALMTFDIGPGDAVFCPSFTFAATAEAIALLGAKPVFVDILPDTFNIDVQHLKTAIAQIKKVGEFAPKAVIAVDLFGQIADYPSIKALCDEFDLKLISDAAQGFGSTRNGRQAGYWADLVCTSFFPAKPLGCYGDGGAVLTNDDELADLIRSIRVHGKGSDKYDNVRIGINSRLDTIQAAVLIEKLTIFANEIEKRNKVAARYSEALRDVVQIPHVPARVSSTWAQYTIQYNDREQLQAHLREAGVPNVVYYAKPLHLQTAYRDCHVGGNGLPITDQIQNRVLSLPMHPYLEEETQEYIIQTIFSAIQDRE